jgi:hypothetical protein
MVENERLWLTFALRLASSTRPGSSGRTGWRWAANARLAGKRAKFGIRQRSARFIEETGIRWVVRFAEELVHEQAADLSGSQHGQLLLIEGSLVGASSPATSTSPRQPHSGTSAISWLPSSRPAIVTTPLLVLVMVVFFQVSGTSADCSSDGVK